MSDWRDSYIMRHLIPLTLACAVGTLMGCVITKRCDDEKPFRLLSWFIAITAKATLATVER